jgi:hypothetical protein
MWKKGVIGHFSCGPVDKGYNIHGFFHANFVVQPERKSLSTPLPHISTAPTTTTIL